MTQRKTLTAAAVALAALAGGQLAAWTQRPRQRPSRGTRASSGSRPTPPTACASSATPRERPTSSAPTPATRWSTPPCRRPRSVRAAAQCPPRAVRRRAGPARTTPSCRSRGSERSPSGQDVVRFQQEVDSAPVIGGQVVVSLRDDRQLAPCCPRSRPLRSLPAATVTEADARATALQSRGGSRRRRQRPHRPPARAARSGTPRSSARPPGLRPRASGSFEVGDGAGVRRLVLVDDTNGRVLVNLDQIEHIDRVVCDRNNVRGAETPCTSGFARVEGGPASGVADVDAAFDHAGSTSATAYSQIAGIDLTDKLGVDVGGGEEARRDRALLPADDGPRPARTPTRSGTAPRCSTATPTPPPTTSSGTR